MNLTVIDHDYPAWNAKKKRENGAATYSYTLVKYQIPKWKKSLSISHKGKRVIISTCPKFSDLVDGKYPLYDLAIQYLHTYPYDNPIQYIKGIVDKMPFKTKRLVFITAYRSFQFLLQNAGFECIYQPMSINTQVMESFQSEKKFNDRIIYFGNLYVNKRNLHRDIYDVCEHLGLGLDTISNGMINGIKPLNQTEAWQLISKYKYGIGVGRCALEMFELGLKVFICGAEIGGLVIDKNDYIIQEQTNFNGRVITFDRNITTCLTNIEKSIIPNVNCITKMNHSK